MSNEWDSQNADRLLNAFTESIITTNDSEYLQERKEDGIDTKEAGENVRRALMAGVKQYFIAQRPQLASATSSSTSSKSFLDRTREQLQKILDDTKAKLTSEQAMTLCFRERGAGEMSKAEIISQLEKLHHLGLVEMDDES